MMSEKVEVDKDWLEYLECQHILMNALEVYGVQRWNKYEQAYERARVIMEWRKENGNN